MDEFLISDQTKKKINEFVANPAHLLIINGKKGTGKTTIAKLLIAKVLNLNDVDGLSNYQFYTEITPQEESISIDEARGLQKFLKLRAVGHNNIKRAILINDADYLSIEAQNALLKMFEEPPLDTIIVLTSHSKSNLLPTIYSRAQQIDIGLPDKMSLINYYRDLYPEANIESVYALSSGLPGLMSNLLGNKDHTLLTSMDDAKKILKLSKVDRLNLISQYSNNKKLVIEIIQSIEKIALAGIDISVGKKSPEEITKWTKILEYCQIAENASRKNANTKLLLTTLFINL